MQNPDKNQTQTPPFVSKLAFCWLALLAGVVGGQWFFHGYNKRALLCLFAFPFSAFIGWGEAIRFGLMPDEQFNNRFNPSSPADTRQTTGLVVTAIGLSLTAFVTAFMTLLAIVFQLILSGSVA